MDFGFDFGGLLVGSPLDFYGLPQAEKGEQRHPDIEIRLKIGALPWQRPVSHVWHGRFGLVLERGAVGDSGWTIRYRDRAAIQGDSRGNMLDCVCSNAESVDLLAEILARRVLPRLTNLHGRMPVHAAAIAQDADHGGGAVLLFGTSGAGKSTLTAAAGASGWQILSDDMSILSGSDDPHVWQSAPGVSLWGDSKEALALPLESCREIGGYDGKYWFAPPWRKLDRSVQLRALIFLAAGEMLSCQRISGARAMMLAASQMVRFDPSDIAENAAAMDKFSRLVSNTPCFVLSYPRRYDALPQALETIAAIQHDARQPAL